MYAHSLLSGQEVARMPKVPVNSTIDYDLLQRIDAAAQADGMTRSEWLRDAARAKLQWRRMTDTERENVLSGADDD
jgi:metal-responsive CopG/Arc/MetJ family transcriptional regulator